MLAHSFYSVLVSISLLWPFHLYFISEILPTTLRILTLFSQSYFCLIGPFNYIYLSKSLLKWPRSGELRTQKLKSHLVRTQSLNVLPLKPGLGQHVAIHATLTARDFFLAYFYPSGPFTSIFFFQNLSRFLLWWLWLTHGSCVGPQNKIGHPA